MRFFRQRYEFNEEELKEMESRFFQQKDFFIGEEEYL